jgi:hypothetical protein
LEEGSASGADKYYDEWGDGCEREKKKDGKGGKGEGSDSVSSGGE